MKLKFSASDFRFAVTIDKVTCTIEQKDSEHIAMLAQAKYDDYVAKQSKYFGVRREEGDYWLLSENKQQEDTHVFSVIEVEEIEKKCVEHEPREISHGYNTPESYSKIIGYENRCKHCGVDLKPTGWGKA